MHWRFLKQRDYDHGPLQNERSFLPHVQAALQRSMVFEALMILKKGVLMRIYQCRQPRYEGFSNVRDDWVLYKDLEPYLHHFDKPEQNKYVDFFF